MPARICNSCLAVSGFKLRTLNSNVLPFMGRALNVVVDLGGISVTRTCFIE